MYRKQRDYLLHSKQTHYLIEDFSDFIKNFLNEKKYDCDKKYPGILIRFDLSTGASNGSDGLDEFGVTIFFEYYLTTDDFDKNRCIGGEWLKIELIKYFEEKNKTVILNGFILKCLENSKIFFDLNVSLPITNK